jgi:hypothetical protein
MSCFAAGTPLLTPSGSKVIDEFVRGDMVLSRDEHDINGVVTAKIVEEVFVGTAKIVEIHIGEHVIRTTSQHPFWIQSKGWLPAHELVAGDRLVGHDNQEVVVEKVVDPDQWATVYNLRVADFHTYFVGCDEWGFSVWAHNTCKILIDEALKLGITLTRKDAAFLQPLLASGKPADRNTALKHLIDKGIPNASKQLEELGPQYREAAGIKITRQRQPLDNVGKYIVDNYDGIDALGKTKPGKNMRTADGGNAPPHGHHIVPQVGTGADKTAVEQAHKILNDVGIDPIRGQQNLVWAPYWGAIHTKDYAEKVLAILQKAEQTEAGITEALQKIGKIVSAGGKL